MSPSSASSRLRSHWQALALRERRLVLGAAALVTLALLWWIGLSPALKVLRQSQQQHLELENRLQQVQHMADEARTLQGRPTIRHDEAVRALETSVKSGLGSTAQISFAGDRASIVLKGATAAALSSWLGQARINARALPVEARLVRSQAQGALWDGTLVLMLPPR